MLLEEFREALAALPSYAPVEVRDQLGASVPIGAVDYDSGVIRVSVDDVLLVSDDEPGDEDADLDGGTEDVEYFSTFRYRARMFGEGCGYGYPLCCVLFFVLVWSPLVRRVPGLLDRCARCARDARGVRAWMPTIARRLVAFWVPGPVEYIPCPWHRWRHRIEQVNGGSVPV